MTHAITPYGYPRIAACLKVVDELHAPAQATCDACRAWYLRYAQGEVNWWSLLTERDFGFFWNFLGAAAFLIRLTKTYASRPTRETVG